MTIKLKEIKKVVPGDYNVETMKFRNPILRGDYKFDYTELEKYSASQSVQDKMQKYIRDAMYKSMEDEYHSMIQSLPRKLPSTYQNNHPTFTKPEPAYLKRLVGYKRDLTAALNKRVAVIAERSYDRYRDSSLIAMGIGIVIMAFGVMLLAF